MEDCGKVDDNIIAVLKNKDNDMWSNVKDVNELPL
jgi:inorganic pyrophosphatase